MLSDKEQYAVDYLKTIIADFNLQFSAWRKSTGCEANFRFDYREKKALTVNLVVGIDAQDVMKVLYMREPEVPAAMQRIMDEAKEEAMDGRPADDSSPDVVGEPP